MNLPRTDEALERLGPTAHANPTHNVRRKALNDLHSVKHELRNLIERDLNRLLADRLMMSLLLELTGRLNEVLLKLELRPIAPPNGRGKKLRRTASRRPRPKVPGRMRPHP